MADTANGSPVGVIDFLVYQHHQIEQLFDDTLASSGPQRDEVFVRLRQLLAVHETAEEEVVHPRARKELGDRHDVIDARLQEEHDAKRMLAEMEDLGIDSEAFTRRLRELRDAVVDHAAREERYEFSQMDQDLSDEQLQRITRAVRLAEAIAPTRPHPGVETPLANAFVGPFAALMDRSRDAILGYG